MSTRSDHNRCAPGEVLFILIIELSLFDMINHFFEYIEVLFCYVNSISHKKPLSRVAVGLKLLL